MFIFGQIYFWRIYSLWSDVLSNGNKNEHNSFQASKLVKYFSSYWSDQIGHLGTCLEFRRPFNNNVLKFLSAASFEVENFIFVSQSPFFSKFAQKNNEVLNFIKAHLLF